MRLSPHVERLIDMALDEDLKGGDATTDAIFGPDQRAEGTLLAKTDLVLAGSAVFTAVMQRMDPRVEVRWDARDGDSVTDRTTMAAISGPVRAILKGERTALNLLQRMCGVATLTRSYARELDGTDTNVTDTRKTLPGWRELDKYAVLCGGGRNHRYNLGGGVMIKDNHIAAAGSIVEAVRRVRALAPHTLKIEVEVDTIDQLDDAVGAGADIILLDNMDDATTAEAVKRARALAGARPILLEASGGITIERLKSLAATGVDLISVGALTHSAKAADISLDIKVQG